MSQGRRPFFCGKNPRVLTLTTQQMMPPLVELPPPPIACFEEKKPEEDEIPNLLKCPIGLDLMTNPVMAQCKHNFDEKNIKEWRKIHDSCPCCRQKVTSLKPNTDLKEVADYILKLQKKVELQVKPKFHP